MHGKQDDMEAYKELAEYTAIKSEMTEMFGCDEWGCYIRICPNCPMFKACDIKRKQDENGTEFTNRWENGIVKAFSEYLSKLPAS